MAMTMADNLDGRTRRSNATKAAILGACRALLQDGNLRPSMTEIARRAGCSIRTAFDHFKTVEAMRAEALREYQTEEEVLERVIPGHALYGLLDSDRRRIVHLVVNGKVPEEG